MALITITVNNRLEVGPVDRIPRGVVAKIRGRLTFTNPKWEENERRGFSNWHIPKKLCYLEDHGGRLTLPRGFTRQLVGILHRAGVQYRIEDRRRPLPEVDFQFLGELHDFQQKAVDAMAARDFGTLAAPTGSGKTVATLALVARRRQPALVVVHTRELLEQWVDRIETFLGIPAGEVGRIGGGKNQVGEKITVGLLQSLYKVAQEVATHVGFLIVDEAHRCPSRTFIEAVTAFDSKFMTGLSATPWRRDGLTRLMFWYVGDVAHQIDAAALVGAGHVLEAEVIWRQTDFEPTFDPSEEYSRMLSELTQDPARNALIADDVAREAGNGGGVLLVLSDRVAHCKVLAGLLEALGVKADLLTGDLSNGKRQKVVEDLNAGKVKVLVATSQLVGEGFDSKELSTLFLATPIRFSGRLLQCLGRILRPMGGKEARVFDYVDSLVGVLEHAARARRRVYGV